MQNKSKNTPKRLLINIDEEMHNLIKRICVEKRKTMTDWVKEAVIKQMEYEKDLGF